MVCPKCGRDGVEPGDAFCRHCGFSLASQASAPERAAGIAEKKSATVRDSDAGKDLQIFGGVIFVLAALFGPAIAIWVGLPNFGASVLPWLAGALMMVGLGMFFIGSKLRHAR